MSIFLDLVTFTEETLDEKCHCLWSIVLFTNRPIYSSKPKSFDHKLWIKIDWSSRLQMLFKTGVLKNLAKFTGKHLFWNLF